MCLAAVKLESVQLTRTGHGISGFSFPRFDSNSRIGATGVGGEETGVPTPSSGKLPTVSLALRFCGIAIHARARTLARGARVRVRSNFTCNFAVEGAPRRLAGFLIISSCSRPGGILTGNNSTYGNSAIDIARCWKVVDASVDRDETKMELPASRVGHSLSLSFCSRRISSESSDGNAARIITLQRKYAYANFGIDEQGEEGG